MLQARSTEYIRIYESIVIELFLRRKIHQIDTCVLRFDRENHYYVVGMVNKIHGLNPYIVPDVASIKTVDS